MSSRVGRFGRNLADLAGLLALPLAAAVLPWRLTRRLLRWLAMHARTFQAESEAAWAVASRERPGPDGAGWKRRYRLVRWVERADTGLTLARGARWWRARVDVDGEWPPPRGGQLLLTFHWGAGNWIWRMLREQGIAAHFLARRPGPTDLGASRVALWYGRLRGRALRRIGSLGPLYTGGAGAAVRAALARGESVVAMLDLPSTPSQHPRPAELLGRSVQWPTRLLDVAAEADVPVTVFSCGFDADSGRRRLRVEPLGRIDAASAVQRYAAHLERRLHEAPELWMMWHEFPAMLAGSARGTGEAGTHVPEVEAHGIMRGNHSMDGRPAAPLNRNGES